MTAKWRQRIEAHPVVTVIIIVLGIALLVVLVLGYIFNWGWTGLGPYIPPTKDSNFQRGKTLWDWVQLLGVVAIPVVVGFGAAIFTRVQHEHEQEAAEKRAQIDRDIAHDDRQQAVLQEYVDKMTELLLDKGLDSNEDAKYVVRMRTLAVLSRLDTVRKQSLVQFLYKSGFSNTNIGVIVIDLSNADLSQINLSGANLNGIVLIGANLSEANLEGADLSGSFLIGANLSRAALSRAALSDANLEGADLSDADLSEANLSETNLTNANLDRAKVTDEQLKKAKSLPDGKQSEPPVRSLPSVSEPPGTTMHIEDF